LKIVFTSYASAPEFSDPDKWLQRVAAYTGILENLAKEHEVFAIERINYEGVQVQNGVTYYFVRQQKKIVRFPKNIHRIIQKIAPDIVFINGLVFPLQILQLRFILKKNARILLLHRADKPFTGIKKNLQKLADRYIDGYLFTSFEFGKEWIEQGLIGRPDKIYEVIQASSQFQFKNRESSRSLLGINGSIIFLWVGRLDANKDPVTVVRAFIEFLAIEPAAKLYLIFQQDDLRGVIENILEQNESAKENIKLLGRKSHQELADWYNSSDFIISSSHYEGSGVAVSEAMSCGCIPILTNIPSFRKMTGPGFCGMLYTPGNKEELLNCLIKTKNTDINKEREKVLEQFRQELSNEAIGKKLNRIMKQLT
jgi:glycosyltransferase involved in cell wall biosynthesis